MATIFTFDSLSDLSQARWNDMNGWVESTSPQYFSFHSIPNTHSASGAEFPISPGPERWLQYDVWFAPGFDFGRNNKAHSIGGKMPGMGSRGPHSNMNGHYSGGNPHDTLGFSGRLMWRGHRKDGKSWEPADGIGLGVYAYDLEMALDPNQRYGRQLMFRNDGQVPRRQSFDGDNNGTGLGRIGDTGVWLIPTGQKITITLGYGVGSNHFFEAWTSTETEPTPVRRMRLDSSIGFKWMADQARQEIDSFLMQTYWGGSTADWQPARATEIRYSGITVHDSIPANIQPAPVVIPDLPDPPILMPPVEPTPSPFTMADFQAYSKQIGLQASLSAIIETHDRC